MKSIQIHSFFWTVFSCIRTEYGDLRSKSPHSIRIQENRNQKKLRVDFHFIFENRWQISYIWYVFEAVLFHNRYISKKQVNTFSDNLWCYITFYNSFSERNFRIFFFSFYVGFLSRTFKNHRTAGERRGYFINFSLPLPYFHQLHRHLDNSRAITAESSPLHIASSPKRTGNLWFPSASR